MESINANSKKCSSCGESIISGTRRCPYCAGLQNIGPAAMDVDSAENKVKWNEAEQEKDVPEVEKEVEDKEGQTLTIGIENEDPQQDTLNPESQVQDVPAGTGEMQKPRFVYEPPQVNPSCIPKQALGNGMKVFLTVISAVIPGLGQLVGLIAAIVFMNAEDDNDRKSFGVALLIASIVLFVLTCLGSIILGIAISSIFLSQR